MRHRIWLVGATLALILTVVPRAGRQINAAPALVGVWNLNADQSETREGPPETGERGRNGRGYGAGGSGRGGGFGGGRGGGRGGMGGGRGDPEAMRRLRSAMREIFEAPSRMTIVETESMIILTGADGRTIRLSTDGKKVKDASTGIERKTHWDGDKLVTEISGAGPGRITETYEVDARTGQLQRTLQLEGGGGNPPPRRQVYDRES